MTNTPKGSIANRMKMRLNKKEGLKSLDKVVTDYGFVGGEPYSFDDHEYQIEIIRDVASRIDVRKCSQVGLSELMVQKTLALGVSMQHSRIIFTLPTKEMAITFSKDRFDGAIEQSEFYTAMLKAGSDNASQKKMGTSLIYIAGTFGSKAAISIPAEFVISDEVDFSNEVVLGKLNSRLRHAQAVDENGLRGYRYRFSTPTVTGYGIDKGFQAGDQKFYMCKCEHCEQWVLPDFYEDFVIPGFDKAMIEFTKDDLHSSRYDVQGTWMKCPNKSCGKNLWRSLCNKDRRAWVAKHPDRARHSYQVYPWDVPKYNDPKTVLDSFDDYPLISDFVNFVIGLPYADADNSFFNSPEFMDKQCVISQWIFGKYIVTAPTFAGMDVGKILHLVIAVKIGSKKHIVNMEKITNGKTDPALPKILARYDYYRVIKMCIDAGPDTTLVNALLMARENIQSVVYVNNISGPLPIAERMDGDVVNADRTKTLTLLLKDHNSGDILYPFADELRTELTEHLGTTKKIRERGTDGEVKERFVKSSTKDHWIHALNYASIAELTLQYLAGTTVHYALPTVGRVVLGSGVVNHDVEKDNRASLLSGLFGVGSGAAAVRKKIR